MSRFAKYAWFVSAYTILVILWGAVVRATGSGAGCGNHWPACNGEILHRPEQIETLIELSHRLTSAFAGVLVIILLIWAFRAVFAYNQTFIRRMAIMTFVFILIEGALGAALVRFELVADNASVARAVVIGLHLVNTLILLGFSTLTAWGATHQHRAMHFEGFSRQGRLMLIGIIGFILLSAIGAVTALGDTLFPVESLIEGIRQDLDPTANFLIQLRIWHPIFAIVVSAFLFYTGYQILGDDSLGKNRQITRFVNLLFAVITLQVVGGFINVLLLAPIWMQIVHLLLADLMWMLIIVLSAEVWIQPQTAKQKNTMNQSTSVMA
ncbi:MAG: COX15/CtaA family protein [Phototrophicaceae bacterium]